MLYGLAIVLIPLFIGYFFKLSNHKLLGWVNKVVSICLYLILLVIGISLGQLDDIVTKLPHIGATSSQTNTRSTCRDTPATPNRLTGSPHALSAG